MGEGEGERVFTADTCGEEDVAQSASINDPAKTVLLFIERFRDITIKRGGRNNVFTQNIHRVCVKDLNLSM